MPICFSYFGKSQSLKISRALTDSGCAQFLARFLKSSFSSYVHLKVMLSVSFSDIYSSLISNCFRTQFNPDIRPVNWSLIACDICIVIDASFLGLRCLVMVAPMLIVLGCGHNQNLLLGRASHN